MCFRSSPLSNTHAFAGYDLSTLIVDYDMKLSVHALAQSMGWEMGRKGRVYMYMLLTILKLSFKINFALSQHLTW